MEMLDLTFAFLNMRCWEGKEWRKCVHFTPGSVSQRGEHELSNSMHGWWIFHGFLMLLGLVKDIADQNTCHSCRPPCTHDWLSVLGFWGHGRTVVSSPGFSSCRRDTSEDLEQTDRWKACLLTETPARAGATEAQYPGRPELEVGELSQANKGLPSGGSSVFPFRQWPRL